MIAFFIELTVILITPSDSQYPLILIPGDGGSQAYCQPKDGSTPYLVWINLWYFLRPESLSDSFSVTYNSTTGEIKDSELCKILFPGWGNTWSIENLDTRKHDATVYFEYLVSAILKDSFFVPNKTLRGAPFDFRKSPNQNLAFMERLKLLIEETFTNSDNKPVVLLGHSLGSLYSLSFLQSVTTTWKHKYIKAFLSVSAPLGGSVKALKLEVSGDNLDSHVRSPLSFRSLERSMPSTAFLLPNPRLWPSTEPILITPKINYSAHDYEKLFSDIGAETVYQLMQVTKTSVDGFVGPDGVDEVYCVHGVGLPTVYQVVYSEPTFYHKGFPDAYTNLIYGDGDGTVHTRSLEVCRFWPSANYVVLQGAEHLRIVRESRFINLVKEVIGIQD